MTQGKNKAKQNKTCRNSESFDSSILERGSYQKYSILALYKFVEEKKTTAQVQTLRDKIESFLRGPSVAARGTIILAQEGINGTICYSQQKSEKQENHDADDGEDVLAFFSKQFPNIRSRLSYSDGQVFHRLKVRIKAEIVTLGCGGGDSGRSSLPVDEMMTEESLAPTMSSDVVKAVDPTISVGTYVPPGPAWDALISDPDCLVIDVRNEYEIALGTFPNAINPHTQSFTEIPEWLEREFEERRRRNASTKVAMFCTGGIRCEKSTSFYLELLKKKDNDNAYQKNHVECYHLEGGILAYLDQVPKEESMWQGECYVFDRRTAVTHGLEPSRQYTLCRACRFPINERELLEHQRSDFEMGISCPNCYHDKKRQSQRQRYEDRQRQINLSKEKGIPHMHDAKEVKLRKQYQKQHQHELPTEN